MRMDVRHYIDATGKDLFQRWFDSLRDPRGRIAILRRVDRLELGNAGDHAACRDGVWEMRIDQGPGYRVYIAKDGNAIVLLLGGGIKDTQQRDIDRAVTAWNDYKRRRCA